MEPTAILLTAIVGAVSALIGAFIAVRKFPIERKQTEATTAATLTGAAGGLVDDLWAELERLRQRVDTYEAAILTLQERDREKERQIADFEERLSLAQARIKELETQNKALQQENEELRKFYEKANGM